MTADDNKVAGDNSVGQQWVEALREGGYETSPLTRASFARIRRYSRVWRKLHELLLIKPGDTLFEFGCGGGRHLVPLALNGHSVSGIDVSKEVLQRCSSFIQNVEQFANRKLSITLYHGDFLEFSDATQYDVVFNFGVIEHFIDDTERLFALKKMLSITKPGGYIVSVVPNGIHPLRERQRAENLGGYHVPEIDYDKQKAAEEILEVGAINPQVYPLNIFWHLTMDSKLSRSKALLYKSAYYAGQFLPLPASNFAFRHAGSLIIIGRKPV